MSIRKMQSGSPSTAGPSSIRYSTHFTSRASSRSWKSVSYRKRSRLIPNLIAIIFPTNRLAASIRDGHIPPRTTRSGRTLCSNSSAIYAIAMAMPRLRPGFGKYGTSRTSDIGKERQRNISSSTTFRLMQLCGRCQRHVLAVQTAPVPPLPRPPNSCACSSTIALTRKTM